MKFPVFESALKVTIVHVCLSLTLSVPDCHDLFVAGCLSRVPVLSCCWRTCHEREMNFSSIVHTPRSTARMAEHIGVGNPRRVLGVEINGPLNQSSAPLTVHWPVRGTLLGMGPFGRRWQHSRHSRRSQRKGGDYWRPVSASRLLMLKCNNVTARWRREGLCGR